MRSLFCAIATAVLAMEAPVHAKTVTIFFGDIQRMPFTNEAPALIASSFQEAVFGRLIKVDVDYSLNPSLLKRFYYEPEKGGYVLEISDALKFHNGRKVTASDLEFSLLRGFFSKANNFFAVFFGNIEGVKAIKPGTKFKSGAVSGVKVLDGTRLLVKLSAPNPSFLHSMGNLLASLVPQEELEADYFTWKKWPVGAGPYSVAKVDPKNFTIELKPERSGLPTYKLQYARSKEIPDISLEAVNGFEKRLFQRPSQVSAIFFSSKNETARDRNFRLGFASAVDRSSLVTDEYQAASQLLPPSFWGRNDKEPRPALGSKPKIPEHIRGGILNLNRDVPPPVKRMVKVMEDTITKLGAKPEVRVTANKFLSEAESVEGPVYGMAFIASYFDPLITFKGMGPGSPVHGLYWENDQKLNELFKSADTAKDFMARLNSIRKLSQYVVEEAYVVPLTYKYASVYFNSKSIKSIGALDAPELIHLDQVQVQ